MKTGYDILVVRTAVQFATRLVIVVYTNTHVSMLGNAIKYVRICLIDLVAVSVLRKLRLRLRYIYRTRQQDTASASDVGHRTLQNDDGNKWCMRFSEKLTHISAYLSILKCRLEAS